MKVEAFFKTEETVIVFKTNQATRGVVISYRAGVVGKLRK
jgi:hypothetical protein